MIQSAESIIRMSTTYLGGSDSPTPHQDNQYRISGWMYFTGCAPPNIAACSLVTPEQSEASTKSLCSFEITHHTFKAQHVARLNTNRRTLSRFPCAARKPLTAARSICKHSPARGWGQPRYRLSNSRTAVPDRTKRPCCSASLLPAAVGLF